MALRAIGENVWAVEAARDPSGLLPVRSALFRLGTGGGLVIFSPIPELPASAAELRGLGEVQALVAPNVMHHLGLEGARRLFPAARVLGRPSLQAKRPDLKFDGTLGEAPDPLLALDFDQCVVGGMPRLDEVVFFHRPSRTLVLSDLCFNVRAESRWGVRTFLWMNLAFERFGPSRICRMLMADRRQVRLAVDRMLAWAPQRILLSHGDLVEAEAVEQLRAAFAFLPAAVG